MLVENHRLMNNGYSHGKLLGGVWRKVGIGEGDSQKKPLYV